MSRFSFGIFGQNSDELIAGLDVKIRDVNNTVIADKSGNLAHTITDNGDGTYYVDTLPQSLVSVYVGDSAQDELQNIFFPTEATTDHIDDDTKHRAINDAGTGATETFSNSKVNLLLASKSDTSHNHSNEYAPIVHDHDGDYVNEGGECISVDGSEADLNFDHNFVADPLNQLSIKQEYSGNQWVTETNRIDQNLQALDSILQGVEGVEGIGQIKVIANTNPVNWADDNVSDASPIDNPPEWYESDGDPYVVKIQTKFYKGSTDNVIHISGECEGHDVEASNQ